MGSFRTAATRRKSDTRTITAADRPEDVPETDADGNALWLGPNESITFWRKLPHGAVTRMVTSATKARLDAKGRPIGADYDAGEAVRVRLIAGIIDWVMFDENNSKVRWDPAHGDELIDGLPDAVHTFLLNNIGQDAPPALSEIDDETAETTPDGEVVGPTVGETSADD